MGDTRSGVATQTTADDFATVKKHYDDYLASEGFTIKSSNSGSQGANQSILIAADKGSVDLGLMIATDGKRTTVTITLQGARNENRPAPPAGGYPGGERPGAGRPRDARQPPDPENCNRIHDDMTLEQQSPPSSASRPTTKASA